MRDTRFSTTVERAQALDVPGRAAQKALDRVFEAVPEPVEQALNGDWYGHPLHPAVVIAPLGAFTTTVVLDTFGNESVEGATEIALSFGLATSVVAAATGAAQWHGLKSKEIRRTGAAHAGLNTVALGLFGASLVARRKGKLKVGKAAALLGLVVLGASAYLGGHMTYKLRAGVE